MDGGGQQRLSLAANGKSSGAPSSPPGKLSVFVERDYSRGIQVRFHERFPVELEGKMDPVTFQGIMQRLNEIYEDAETPSCATAWENCIGCCTCYLAFLVMESRYNKCLKKARAYLAEQNKALAPRGIIFIDPYERGMRLVEIRLK